MKKSLRLIAPHTNLCYFLQHINHTKIEKSEFLPPDLLSEWLQSDPVVIQKFRFIKNERKDLFE